MSCVNGENMKITLYNVFVCHVLYSQNGHLLPRPSWLANLREEQGSKGGGEENDHCLATFGVHQQGL